MGLSSSKHNAAGQSPPSSSSYSSASSGAAVRRSRSGRSRLLKSSCLRSHGDDCDEPQVVLLVKSLWLRFFFFLYGSDFCVHLKMVECGVHVI